MRCVPNSPPSAWTRREAEARAVGAEAMVTHLKFVIAKLEHHRYAPSSERGRKLLDQAELQLEEFEADASEEVATAEVNADQAESTVRSFTRRKPVRGPLPAHLPRERVVIPGPTACPCCGGALAKLGETITESLESVPRQWKVIQTVREKFVCRACETINQPPAPFHPIARGRAGPNLLAMILDAKFGNHQPLNRQSEVYAREGIDLDVSTLADWERACTTSTDPRSQRSRASRRGGHVTTRARSSWSGRPAAVLCSRHPYPGSLAILLRPSTVHRETVSRGSMPFNNAAERALRGIALGRKAWLFAGSDRGGERAAGVYSLIVTAKLNDVDPRAWLADVLARIADHPASRLHELLPWHWPSSREVRSLAA